MAAASRRRAVAAAVTALLAMALAAAVAGRGCRGEDDLPEGTVRAFAAAARAHDRDALYELLGPATRARLESAARRATELVGGQRFAPQDLIRSDLDRLGPVRVLRVEQDGARAVVEVADELDQPAAIELVKVDGHWRIELPAYVTPETR